MISIIVPIYNTIKYLDQCVKSILSQTYHDIEIILVDDGSTDGCGELCDQYAKVDQRVQVIHKENGGATSARKAGVTKAKGNYISFVDSDDWLENDLYESLIVEIAEMEPDVVVFGYIYDKPGESKEMPPMKAEGIYEGEKLEKEVFSDMLYNIERGYACVRPNLNMKLIRNVVISKVIKDTPDSIDIGDDLAVSYLSILRSKNIYISNNIGYHYRIHEESMTHNIKSNYFENIGCLYNYLSKSFNAGSYANCMIGQLNGYMEYLLSEGSHHLLGVSKSRNKIFLFPYEMVPPKTKIAIYGAGEVGIDYMKQLEQNHYCDVVCWVDKNYISKQQQGYKVSSPLELQSCEVDIILVAIENENVARSVRDTYLGENETAKWLWTLPIVID